MVVNVLVQQMTKELFFFGGTAGGDEAPKGDGPDVGTVSGETQWVCTNGTDR